MFERVHCRLGIESLAKWKPGVKWLEHFKKRCTKGAITGSRDVNEDIATDLEDSELQIFQKQFLVVAAEVTALEHFDYHHWELGKYLMSANSPAS